MHFRDFMALQLTPMVGMTAYPDRMGDSFPDLLTSGRLIQGHNVSGPLSAEIVAAVDRDLSDPRWRHLFGTYLRTNLRFQEGLFDRGQPIPERMDRLEGASFNVDGIRKRCGQVTSDETELDYGLALIKTAASLIFTYRLALNHGLQVATDSPAHFELFEQTRTREPHSIANHLIARKGY